ncbi:hypothetical protein CgunFtcFv8_027504 [Champsocephalus gunnari]|uniref:Uncharacterized protein n=1 Tax=Champsocephalus gunnari TaxID=52237 RepID=A0AAN8DY65_CHAGU|nr:hypothetical protein CgunFtcFv8_027504 [Champsocephalus gunnari]
MKTPAVQDSHLQASCLPDPISCEAGSAVQRDFRKQPVRLNTGHWRTCRSPSRICSGVSLSSVEAPPPQETARQTEHGTLEDMQERASADLLWDQPLHLKPRPFRPGSALGSASPGAELQRHRGCVCGNKELTESCAWCLS